MHEREAHPSRRDMMCWSAGALAATTVLQPSAFAQAAQTWQAAVGQILGEARPIDGKLLLELPEIAENGNTVPFTVGSDSPMSETSHVKSLHVLATGNPQALISNFYFTPASGKAIVSGRLRLAKTQQIIAIAALSDGRFVMDRREVKVTIGGCGG
jgi:sulfur-oxidizing protein SoxY